MKKFGLAIVKKCISLALSIILLVNSYPILLAHAASAPTYDQVAQKYSLSYVDTYIVSSKSYKCYTAPFMSGKIYLFFSGNTLETNSSILNKLAELYMINHQDDFMVHLQQNIEKIESNYNRIAEIDGDATLQFIANRIGILTSYFLKNLSLDDAVPLLSEIIQQEEVIVANYITVYLSFQINKIKSMPSHINNYNDAKEYIETANSIMAAAGAYNTLCSELYQDNSGGIEKALRSVISDISLSESLDIVKKYLKHMYDLISVTTDISKILENVESEINNLPPKFVAFFPNLYCFWSDINSYTNEFNKYVNDCAIKVTADTANESISSNHQSNAAVKVIKSSNLKTLPCSSGTDPNSKTVRKTTVGEQLEITDSVVNSVGNLWYKTYSNGTTCYVYAGDTSIISDPIALNNVNYPNTLKQGSVYVLNGTITSKLSNLTKVTVGVYNSNGSMVTGATVSPNNRTYNIHNVDNQVLFNILSTGQYTYQITATNAAGQHTLLSKSFSVTASSNTTNQTPQIQEGKVVHCQTIVQLPARVINLYTNPTDASRTTYFDYGPRVNCPEYMIMSDGSIMYHGNVNHKGVDTQMWFKKEADMSFDIRHTYNNNICECGATKSSLPTNSSVATDKTCYQVGETVTVTPRADNAVKYTISVYSGGNKIFSNYSGFTNSISFTPEQVGSYSVVVSCIDSQGKYVDATCTFSVVNESRTISDGTYAMFSQYAANLRLDINGSSDFEFNDDNPGKNRQFKVIYQNNGYYKIQDIKTGKYFTAVGTAKGSDIQIQEENNSDAQLWAIRPAKGNYYYICSKSANLLPIEAGSNSGKLSIRLGIMDGIAQQMWMFDLDDAEQDTQFPIINSYDTGLFIDVKESAWFAENVKRAYEYGLMNGTGTTTFNPDDNITIAETITIASRICSIYNGDNQPFARINNAPWYQPYVNYAQQKGIIPVQNSISKYNDYATRLEFAQILANALPDEALKEKNDIKDNAIPDVNSSTQGAAYVYQLYRAGVLTGNDSSGRFFPSSYITRAETAAVVSRMADPALRMETLL